MLLLFFCLLLGIDTSPAKKRKRSKNASTVYLQERPRKKEASPFFPSRRLCFNRSLSAVFASVRREKARLRNDKGERNKSRMPLTGGRRRKSAAGSRQTHSSMAKGKRWSRAEGQLQRESQSNENTLRSHWSGGRMFRLSCACPLIKSSKLGMESIDTEFRNSEACLPPLP